MDQAMLMTAIKKTCGPNLTPDLLKTVLLTPVRIFGLPPLWAACYVGRTARNLKTGDYLSKFYVIHIGC